MHILQGGAPKSGNFWLYRIIQEILTRTGHSTRSFIEQQPVHTLAKSWDLNFPEQSRIDVLDITDLQCSYRISSIYRMPVEDMSEYVSKTRHVWTHSPVCKISDSVYSYFDKKVYIIRDPRDRAISATKYFTSPYMLKYFPQPEKEPENFLNKNFEELMIEWVWHVFDHLRLSSALNIHIVFYENFLNKFQNELEDLLQYLKLDLPEIQRKELEKAVSFNNMKTKSPKHLKKGKAGYWKDVLNENQVSKAEIIAGPLMKYLGYADNMSTPQFNNSSEKVFEQLKQAIIQSQRPLYQQ